MKRKIIKIDEDKCNGCGDCVINCEEGALKIIDGKAKLVKEAFCDGLGACIGECPLGALTIEEREADDFDEQQAREHSRKENVNQPAHHPPQGCPGVMAKQWDDKADDTPRPAAEQKSALRQWPIELKLLNPQAPCFQNADLVVAADCVAFSYADFHGRFLQGKALVIFCPKLDNAYPEYSAKLTAILSLNEIKSITVVHMEVPCCSGTIRIVEEALRQSRKNIVVKDYTISLRGEIV